MPGRQAPLYRRGKYWLGWDERKDGTRRSPCLTIFWYDPEARRVRSASTGTAVEEDGIVALDARYLADRGEAPAFCPTCGQPRANAETYLLIDAIADYKLEAGSKRASADSIAARLKHVVDFLQAETARGAEGRFGIETSCAAACSTVFANVFRAWSREQPVEWRNKAGDVTVSRPRSPATTEESITQVAAALNHAVDADPPRSAKRPAYRALGRAQVSRPRRTRVSVEQIAKMLEYASKPNKRRESLHAFIVASICTIARPDSIVDICVRPDRGQWWPGAPTIDLNPHGRLQTKKFRPVVPVLPILEQWLTAELAAWRKLDRADQRHAGYLVNYFGRPVQDVDGAWSTMLEKLGLPSGREWKPYVLRHSLATLARNYGAEKWDLEGFMGHRSPSQTEVYAIGDFKSAATALQRVIDELETLAPGSLHRRNTGAGSSNIFATEAKMPG
ncbi:hypothetical protein CA235_18675 [Sphingomonas sp. ABOLF]|uniref:tyrosine-type recombinase/integrase n=1 Tax=Sphingomonas sp. ABOLF TaxID=1985879 RepID=UPI000F7D5D26|nr:tyrosine-type recombinase/integrase [Sphingomonas sp. ABOLF]RSV11570.1 hypothetical protein CA235_18675 [Sphingomonas sp. ABOLF]